MWENILKGTIKKSSYSITWKDMGVNSLDVKNLPDELKNYDEEYDFDTVDSSANVHTIEGSFHVDVRDWGIKGVGSNASEMSFTLTFDDTESDLYEYMEVTVDVSDWKGDFVYTSDENAMRINPAEVSMKIDMKNQMDPKQFEVTGTIYWQGAY